MVMQMRGEKLYPGRGKWVTIPLLPENVPQNHLEHCHLIILQFLSPQSDDVVWKEVNGQLLQMAGVVDTGDQSFSGQGAIYK